MSTAKRRSAAKPKNVPNQLVGFIEIDTLDNCRAVIEFVRQATLNAEGQEIDMGRFLILGLVHDALGTLQPAVTRGTATANDSGQRRTALRVVDNTKPGAQP